MIRSAAREAQVIVLTEIKEVIVDKLRAIVTVYTFQRKGQTLFNSLHALKGVGASFVPDCNTLCPAGCNIGAIKGIGVFSVRSRATMCHQVNFKKTGCSVIPVRASSDLDLVF